MVALIPKSAADAFDLAAEVAAFQSALESHALTVNVPAPMAREIVENIVRAHGGAFEIIDDTPVLTDAERRNALHAAIQKEEISRIDIILSPARRRLASLDFESVNRKAMSDRTTADATRMAEIKIAFDAIEDIQRHSAILAVEVEDLAPDHLDSWQPHGWPA